MNRFTEIIVLLGVFFLGAVGLEAKDKLEVKIDIGYGGVVPASQQLTPVRVQIINNLRELQGRIEIRQPVISRSEVVVIKRFLSPLPSWHSHTLLVRTDVTSRINVTVFFDDKDVKTYRKSGPVPTSRYVVLSSGLGQAYIDQMDGKMVNFTVNYQLVQLGVRDFPDKELAYDAVKAVILTGRQFARLNKRQLKALRNWTAGGGRMMIYGPTQTPDFTRAFEPFMRGRVSIQKTGVYPYGAGTLAVQIMRSVEKDKPFWCDKDRLHMGISFLPDLRVSRGMFSRRGVDGIGWFDDLISRDQSGTYGIMGFVSLLGIIVVYCLFVGPLDAWIVRRSGRTWLTWPLFALSVVLFSFIANRYSQFIQSMPTTSIQLNVVDQVAGEKNACGTSKLWIYSTGGFVFKITTDRKGANLSCRESGAADQSSAAWAKIHHAIPPRISAKIPAYSSKSFSAAWCEPSKMRIIETSTEDKTYFKLPKELKVRTAYLATVDGVYRLSYEASTHELVLHERPQKWPGYLKRAAAIQVDPQSRLPTIKGLENYLMTISYYGIDQSIIDSLGDLGLIRSEFEKQFMIADRLNYGRRVLMLFTEGNLNELDISPGIRRRNRVDLIRYHLKPKITRRKAR